MKLVRIHLKKYNLTQDLAQDGFYACAHAHKCVQILGLELMHSSLHIHIPYQLSWSVLENTLSSTNGTHMTDLINSKYKT